MPNKIKKWEELSREIAFQKYSRKIEKVMDKISDKKERWFSSSFFKSDCLPAF